MDPLQIMREELDKIRKGLNQVRERLDLPPLPPIPPTPPPDPRDAPKLFKEHVEARRPLFGGRRTPVRMRDKETGKEYPSKAALGRDLAHLAGTTSDDPFAFYKLLHKFPGRFEEIE